jgi:hypothetical protein
MKIEDFEEELLTSFKNFINTLKSHPEVGKREDLTYADWFDTFRAHEEVGNEMELEYHGPRVLDVHGQVCQLCASSLAVKINPCRVVLDADALSRSMSSHGVATKLFINPSQTCVDCHEQFWTSTPGRDICAACLAHREQECK